MVFFWVSYSSWSPVIALSRQPRGKEAASAPVLWPSGIKRDRKDVRFRARNYRASETINREPRDLPLRLERLEVLPFPRFLEVPFLAKWTPPFLPLLLVLATAFSLPLEREATLALSLCAVLAGEATGNMEAVWTEAFSWRLWPRLRFLAEATRTLPFLLLFLALTLLFLEVWELTRTLAFLDALE